MNEYSNDTLKTALRNLVGQPSVPDAVRYLAERSEAINEQLKQAVLTDISAFTESSNPDILPQLGEHCIHHTQEIFRLLNNGAVRDFEFVRNHAERRAEQRFPLEATLHAYRLGHKIYSGWLREAMQTSLPDSADSRIPVAAIADFTMEYTDAISTIATGSYLARTRLLADVAGDERAELLSILLDGYDESNGRVAGILRRAGYLDGRKAFSVALAQSVDPAEMNNPARARRMADAIDKILQGSPGRRHIDLRDNRVIIVFADARRASGWTAPNTSLARRVMPRLKLVGNAALIGLSNDVPSTSQIPTAYREASLALEMADPGNRVVQFSDLSIRRLMIHFANEELQGILPAWTAALMSLDEKSNGIIVATLRAYAQANMNVLKAAEHLNLHPNTIYARFRKISDRTDLDPKSFHDLNELLIVADCANSQI